MENLYCTIFIVDISQNPDESETVSSRIQQLIEDHGGIIKKFDRWGKRRMAFSIQKKSHGFYVEIEFSANSRLNIPKILEGEYRLNDRVLRHMTYIVDKKELIQREKKAGKAAEMHKVEKSEVKEKVKESVAVPPPPVPESSEKIVTESPQIEVEEKLVGQESPSEKEIDQSKDEHTEISELVAGPEMKDQAEEISDAGKEIGAEEDEKPDLEEKAEEQEKEVAAEKTEDQVEETEKPKEQQPAAEEMANDAESIADESPAEDDSKKNES